MKGQVKAATGSDQGLSFTPAFYLAVLQAFLVGDVLNIMGYRIRPYEVTKGATTAHVTVNVGDQTMTASITNEAVDELGLKPGQKAIVVIKASDVMIAVD